MGRVFRVLADNRSLAAAAQNERWSSRIRRSAARFRAARVSRQCGGTLLAALATVLASAAEPGMVFIPSGDYLRGRTYEWKDYDMPWSPNPSKDDRPVKRISIDRFRMDEAEVTNERYAAFVKATRHAAPYHWKDGKISPGKLKHPVTNVSWEDASAFCAWEGKRLPTEAEWERACRGLADNNMFPWGNENPTAKQARFGAVDGPIEVCKTERNYFGLCDIIGNVWEWTADWYDRKYYEVAPDRNPAGPATGLYRVLRGGSWFDQPKLFLSCSYRSWARPEELSPTIGFRCVKSFPVTLSKGR